MVDLIPPTTYLLFYNVFETLILFFLSIFLTYLIIKKNNKRMVESSNPIIILKK